MASLCARVACVSRDTYAGCGATCNSQLHFVHVLERKPAETPKLPWSLLRAGGRHGLSDDETRDPIGLAVLALNKIASSDLHRQPRPAQGEREGRLPGDQRGLPHGRDRRPHVRPGRQGAPRGNRVPAAKNTGALRPRPRPRTSRCSSTWSVSSPTRWCARPRPPPTRSAPPPRTCSRPTLEIGLPILGVPEELGGIATERSAMAGTLVAEALAKGDMGLAVAALAPGRRRHRDLALGHRRAAVDLPAGVHRRRGPGRRAGPRRADARCSTRSTPPTTADGEGRRLRPQRREVRRRARRRGRAVRRRRRARRQAAALPRRVEAPTGVTIEADPSMGLRAAEPVAPGPQGRRRSSRSRCSATTRRLPRVRPALAPRLVRPGRRHRRRRCSTT